MGFFGVYRLLPSGRAGPLLLDPLAVVGFGRGARPDRVVLVVVMPAARSARTLLVASFCTL